MNLLFLKLIFIEMENPVEWKSLAYIGFSNYEDSSTGLIRNKTSGYMSKGSLKKKSGYYISHISDDNGTFKTITTHRLITFAFHGLPPTSNHTVDHINRNKEDNRAVNLKWSDKKEQILNRNPHKQKLTRGKAITQILQTGEEIFTWFKAIYASMTYKCDHGDLIKACKSGKLYQGFYWKYERGLLEGEIWKQAISNDFICDVWASNKGRIFINLGNGKLTYGHTSNGYKHVSMKTKDNNSKLYLVHRLVMLAFYGPDERIVNHLDNNGKNNKLENLKYETIAENNIHAVQFRNPENLNNHMSKAVVQMDLDGLYINEFPSGKEAERQTGISAKRISDVINGRYNFHKTFKWAHKKNYVHIGYSPLYKGDIK